MVKKCSVYGCRTGYRDQTEKISVYSFPKDGDELQTWLRCLPNIIEAENVTKHMGVCALHWPEGIKTCRRGKHDVPAVPPSVFPNVPASSIPTAQFSSTTPRSTSKALSRFQQTHIIDEMKEFREKDRLKEDVFFQEIPTRLTDLDSGRVIVKRHHNTVTLLSNTRSGPIFDLSAFFKFNPEDCTLTYEIYRSILRVQFPGLKNLKYWSELDELLRCIRNQDKEKAASIENVPRERKTPSRYVQDNAVSVSIKSRSPKTQGRMSPKSSMMPPIPITNGTQVPGIRTLSMMPLPATVPKPDFVDLHMDCVEEPLSSVQVEMAKKEQQQYEESQLLIKAALEGRLLVTPNKEIEELDPAMETCGMDIRPLPLSQTSSPTPVAMTTPKAAQPKKSSRKTKPVPRTMETYVVDVPPIPVAITRTPKAAQQNKSAKKTKLVARKQSQSIVNATSPLANKQNEMRSLLRQNHAVRKGKAKVQNKKTKKKKKQLDLEVGRQGIISKYKIDQVVIKATTDLTTHTSTGVSNKSKSKVNGGFGAAASSHQAVVKSLNVPAVQKYQDLSLHLPMECSKLKCVECGVLMNTAGHYGKFVQCPMCRFASSCSQANTRHMQMLHSGKARSSKSLRLPADRKMVAPLYCECGFSSVYGNKIANHLVSCSKSSCYKDRPPLPTGDTFAPELQDPRNKPDACLLYVLGLVKKEALASFTTSDTKEEFSPSLGPLVDVPEVNNIIFTSCERPVNIPGVKDMEMPLCKPPVDIPKDLPLCELPLDIPKVEDMDLPLCELPVDVPKVKDMDLPLCEPPVNMPKVKDMDLPLCEPPVDIPKVKNMDLPLCEPAVDMPKVKDMAITVSQCEPPVNISGGKNVTLPL